MTEQTDLRTDNQWPSTSSIDKDWPPRSTDNIQLAIATGLQGLARTTADLRLALTTSGTRLAPLTSAELPTSTINKLETL